MLLHMNTDTTGYANRFAVLDAIAIALPPTVGAKAMDSDYPGGDPQLWAWDLNSGTNYLLVSLEESDDDEAPRTGQAQLCDAVGNPYRVLDLRDTHDADATAVAIMTLL